MLPRRVIASIVPRAAARQMGVTRSLKRLSALPHFAQFVRHGLAAAALNRSALQRNMRGVRLVQRGLLNQGIANFGHIRAQVRLGRGFRAGLMATRNLF
jgi:hypothetical protein